ncbi:YihY family inner membrane protein [Chitinasiproducens palmae]|uniref:UPF0761 membrane protein SAMN05216551_114151 n=1 Tax=Chitinasiproducens palmae TaxID=1770053 RepID=A0A1H2PWW3_9BURK|nr:membrane protein [Chitinasiproducens palmae]
MLNFPIDLLAIRRLTRFATKRIAEDRVAQVAGSLTFTTVLSVVPLITVAFAIFTAFPIFSTFQEALRSFLTDRLMPPSVNQQIFEYLNEFADKAKGLTTAGMIVLVLTSLLTMTTVESAFNVIWRVRKARPFSQRLLVYWAALTLGPLLFGLSVSVSSYVWTESIASVSGALEARPWAGRWLISLSVLPLTALGYSLLYLLVPNCRVEWRDALAGGVAAALAFEVAKRGFGTYIRSFPTYTAVYGTFAAFPIFLLWVYLSWFITLAGAMIASALPDIRAGHFFRPRFPGSDLLDALGVLARLGVARDKGRVGYAAAELSRMLRRDLDTTVRLLHALESRGLIARLDYGRGPQRWLLLVNPEQVELACLFDLFVVDRRELAYQLELGTARVDRATLLDALDAPGLKVTLATLLAARAAHPSARSPRTEAIDAALRRQLR